MKIKFNIDDAKALENWPVVLAKDYLPEWYSKLDRPKDGYKFDDDAAKSIRACPPVNDFITSGYILRATYEMRIREQIKNFVPSMHITTASNFKNEINRPEKTDINQGLHANNTVNIYSEETCPMKGKKFGNYFRVDSEWAIETPPGYSCLVLQPYYFFNPSVSIMPAIIDTDKFHEKIPVVGYLNNTNEYRFSCGDPLLQVIPFKRDSWTSEFTTKKILQKSKFFLFNAYSKLFHSEKQFK